MSNVARCLPFRAVPLVRSGPPRVVWPGESPTADAQKSPHNKGETRIVLTPRPRSDSLSVMSAPAALPVGTDAPKTLATIKPARLPRDAAIDSWQRDMATRLGRSVHTVRKGPENVKRLLDDAEMYELDDITPQRVVKYLQGFIEKRGDDSRKTAQNRLSELRSFMKYVWLMENREGDPLVAVTLPAVRSRKGWSTFSDLDLCAIIDAAEKREAEHWQARISGPLCSTFYRFLAYTGLRREEAETQAWNDVDLKALTLQLTHDKSRRNDTIPISRDCADLLIEWRRHSKGDLLFPKAPSHHSLQADMESAGVKVQEDGKRGQWHRFRKTAITLRARAGTQLRELHKFSRHVSVDTTANVYDDHEVEELRDAAELMDKVIRRAEKTIDGGRDIDDTSAPGSTSSAPSSAPKKTPIDKGDRPKDALAQEPEHSGMRSPMTVGAFPAKGRFREPMSLGDEEWSRGESNPRLHPEIVGEALRLLLESQCRLIRLAERLLPGGRAADGQRASKEAGD